MDRLQSAVPRFQDLTREEAFAVEARVLQRMLPLLLLDPNADKQKAFCYFRDYVDLSHLLIEVSIGNIGIPDCKPTASTLHRRLDESRLFQKPSVPAAEAVLVVTDALADLGTIRYFTSFITERDTKNCDVGTLVAQGGATLSKFGMNADVFWNPSALDCDYIFNNREPGIRFVNARFFSRDLWPLDASGEPSLPFALGAVIIKEWEQSISAMGLGGVALTFNNLSKGVHVVASRPRKAEREQAMVNNNVTLNFSNGASFTGPLAVGEHVRLSLEAAMSTDKDDLRAMLEKVVSVGSKLAEAAPEDEAKLQVSEQLSAFVDEAKKEKPNRWTLKSTAQALIDAASTISTLATPVSEAITAVLAATGN